MLLVLLRVAASLDVRTAPVYLFMYVVVGLAWMRIAEIGFALAGVGLRDNVIERRNGSAAVGLMGALVAVALCYGGGNVGCMNRSEHQVSGLCRRKRYAHRLRVTHFADDDDVGSLTHGSSESSGEVGCVDADLDLLDHAAAVRVLVLDRIFDRHDVARVLAVDFGDERGERCCLAGAGGATHEDQSTRQLCKRCDVVREVQVGDTRDASGQRPNRRCRPATLTAAGSPRSPP